MTWRPEGWWNPHQRTSIKGDQSANEYEWGADAMLEALRKTGQRFDGEQVATIHVPTLSAHGYLIFIPDEEK